MKTSLILASLVLTSLMLTAPAVHAAVSSQDQNVEGSLMTALKLPLANRLQALEAQGESAFDGLAKMAFDKTQPLQVRWRSLTALPRLDAKKSKPYLEQAAQSDQWFMRNAALIGMANMDRTWALKWSVRLLQDPALVVRTAAVKNIDTLNGIELEKHLWNELSHQRNFVKGQSLWIRRHIAKTLSRFARKGQERQFVTLLADDDKSLHPWAIHGLEKITQKRMGSNKDSVKKHRSKWISWWQKQGQNSASL